MTQTKKSPFIQGFKQPTLTKNNFITLADIRGDGEGKLVIWSDDQSQLIVYKGSNRQLQKPSKIKNVSGIITYFDEQRSPKAVIGMSAQNGFYIFRSMNESFRLRVPDIFADESEQILWSQYESQPQKLSQELSKLPKTILSQTARHFISATTEQRKLQLINKVFTQGINEKDSISAMCNLRLNPNSVGNIILGTELNRLYILDCYGHTIADQKIIDSAPMILLAQGSFTTDFLIVSIDRQGDVSFYTKTTFDSSNDSQFPKLKLSSRVITADLSYPDLIVCTQDQVVSCYNLSPNFLNSVSKSYSFKLPKQPIKIISINYKSLKLSLILFQDQFRLYLGRQLIYNYFSSYKLYDALFGSFAQGSSSSQIFLLEEFLELLAIFSPEDVSRSLLSSFLSFSLKKIFLEINLVLLNSRIVSSLCIKTMASKSLFCTGNLILKRIMDQINKLSKKAHRFKFQRRQHNLKLIGMNKKMRPNRIKFTKETLSFLNGPLINKNSLKSLKVKPIQKQILKYLDQVLILLQNLQYKILPTNLYKMQQQLQSITEIVQKSIRQQDKFQYCRQKLNIIMTLKLSQQVQKTKQLTFNCFMGPISLKRQFIFQIVKNLLINDDFLYFLKLQDKFLIFVKYLFFIGENYYKRFKLYQTKMSINEQQLELERFKQKLQKEQVDLSNGLCNTSSKKWDYFEKIKKLSRLKVLHFQRNDNPVILMEVSHIYFVNLKRLILQSNRILNIEILGLVNMPNLQEVDLLKNKVSIIGSIEKWKYKQLSVIKLSIDSVNVGWTQVYRGQMTLKFMQLDSFYSKKNPIAYLKLLPLIKSSSIKELSFKNNEKRETNHLIQYLKDFKVKKK